MKFNCGLNIREKKKVLLDKAGQEAGKWLPYFAWLPVRVGRQDCRWLETVERKREHPFIWDSIFGFHITWAYTNYREAQ